MSDLTRPLAQRIATLPASAPPAADVELPQVAIDGALAALDAGKTKYTNRPGIVPLREWIAAHLTRRFDVPYAPDDITVMCGGTEARFVTVKYFCEAGSHLICPGDVSKIAGAAQLVGAEVHPKVVDPAKVGAIYLTPDDENTESLLEDAKANAWWIIYEPYYASPTHHPAQDVDLRSQVVAVGDLEPRFPGWRIGWMAGSSAHGKLRSYKQSMTICTPSISQWAALAMVEAQ